MIAVRKMKPSDVEDVLSIEAQSFPVPMSKDALLRELKLPMVRLQVAQRQERVCGYLNYWIVEREVHIIVIAVRKDERRKGVGKALFNAMLCANTGAESFHLELRESNVAARSFYEGYGFRVCGKRERYYQSNGENALLMSWCPPPK
jgi:ribosomal-protein-alanine N-acetyltransferase